MARPLRIEFPGAVYHITSRGNAQKAIFLDDKDCAGFLEVVSSVVKRFNFIVHAYCLMSNHYHLFIDVIFEHKDKKSKSKTMYEAYIQYGHTLKDIAEYSGVHYTTVSRAIKKAERKHKK